MELTLENKKAAVRAKWNRPVEQRHGEMLDPDKTEPVMSKPLPAEIVLPKIVIEGFKYPESEWFERAFHIREQHLLESMERERAVEQFRDAYYIAKDSLRTAEAVIAELRAVPESLEELLVPEDGMVTYERDGGSYKLHPPLLHVMREQINRRIQAAEKVGEKIGEVSGFNEGLEAAAKISDEHERQRRNPVLRGCTKAQCETLGNQCSLISSDIRNLIEKEGN